MRYLLLILLFVSRAFAVDYTADANCQGAWFLNGPSCSWELDRSGATIDTLDPGSGSASTTMLRRYSSLDSSIYVPAGRTGASRLFNGYYLTLDNATDLNINGAVDMSIGGSVKLMTVPASAAIQTICGKYLAGGNHRQYRLTATGTGSNQVKFDFTISSNGTAITTVSSTSTTYNDSTWYHVYGVYDGDSMYIFVNGARSNAAFYTGGIASKNGYFTIGSQHLGVQVMSNSFIDEVGLFNRALSAAEVSDIYTNGLKGNAGAGDFPLYTEYLSMTGEKPADADFYTFVNDSIQDICTAYGLTYQAFGVTSGGRNFGGAVINPSEYGNTVVIISGVHGDNPPGSEEFISWVGLHAFKYFADNPPYQVRMVWIPLVNPDGTVASQRVNGNGVNINRNYDWQRSAIPAYPSDHFEYPGASAFSEAETRTVRDAVNLYDPIMFVDLHANSDKIFTIDLDNIDIANEYMSSNGLEPFVKIEVGYVDSGGYGFGWADSVGVQDAWLWETGTISSAAQRKEETNRFIGYLIYHMDRFDSMYVPIATGGTHWNSWRKRSTWEQW